MNRLRGGKERGLELLVQHGRRDLLGAAVAKADVTHLIVDIFGPFDAVAGSEVEDTLDWFDFAADQVAVAAENRLRLGLIGIQADEVAEMGVVGEDIPVRDASPTAIGRANKNFGRVQFVGDYLEVPPNFTGQSEFQCALIGV